MDRAADPDLISVLNPGGEESLVGGVSFSGDRATGSSGGGASGEA